MVKVGVTPAATPAAAAAVFTKSRRFRLFYANRDRQSVIFADDLRELAERGHGQAEGVGLHEPCVGDDERLLGASVPQGRRKLSDRPHTESNTRGEVELRYARGKLRRDSH